MYHARFKGTHYEIGLKWGTRLFKYKKVLLDNVPFPISQERIAFARLCRPFYEKWYPEVLEEIKGIAKGKTGKDTVWSVIYDVGGKKIYRCEGNPSRKKYVEDGRFVF